MENSEELLINLNNLDLDKCLSVANHDIAKLSELDQSLDLNELSIIQRTIAGYLRIKSIITPNQVFQIISLFNKEDLDIAKDYIVEWVNTFYEVDLSNNLMKIQFYKSVQTYINLKRKEINAKT